MPADAVTVTDAGTRADPVAITGLGAITPIGADVETTWKAMLAGQSGVATMPTETHGELPVRIGAPVKTDPAAAFPPARARRLDRVGQLALIAARQAWHDAGFGGKAVECGLDPDRVGVVIGTGHGGLTTLLERYDRYLERGWKALSPFTVIMTMPNASAAAVTEEIGGRAGTHAPVSACATGSEAVGEGVAMIQDGRADVVVVGGAEAALHPFAVSGFAATRGLSRRNDDPAAASRPFDADRDGFVIGEGAGVLVLESAHHAAQRGREPYGFVVGVGYSADPDHPIKSDPSGGAAALAMTRALADGGRQAGDVVHVNAHATSTPAGDVSEARAIESVLGSEVLVTATKSMTGHLLGASGAVEAMMTTLALREGLVPGTVNLDRMDDEVHLTIATGDPTPMPAPAAPRPGLAMSNSFGFGGHNVSLVIGPTD